MRKRMLAIILGVLVFSLVAASAASLGGLNVADVGADTAVVASCDSDGVTVDFVTSVGGANQYQVTGVTLSSVDPECENANVSVALLGAGTTVLTEETGVIATGGSTTISLTDAVLAEQLRRVSVLISAPAPVTP